MPACGDPGSGMQDQYPHQSGQPRSRSKGAVKDLRTTVEEITNSRPEQLRDGYLNRLRRLLRLRRDHFDELNEQGLRLLDRSIFASYCDCIDIGQGEAARSVMKNVRLTLSLSKVPRELHEKKAPRTSAPRTVVDEIAQSLPAQLRGGYLNRLSRLLRLRRDHFDELNLQGLRILDRSIFAALCDCIDIGQGEAAKAILKDVRLTLALNRAPRVRQGDAV